MRPHTAGTVALLAGGLVVTRAYIRGRRARTELVSLLRGAVTVNENLAALLGVDEEPLTLEEALQGDDGTEDADVTDLDDTMFLAITVGPVDDWAFAVQSNLDEDTMLAWLERAKHYILCPGTFECEDDEADD